MRSLLLGNLAGPQVRAVHHDDIMNRLGRNTSGWSGVPVTPRSALGHPAVWKAILLIGGTAATLPLDQLRKVEDPDGDDGIRLRVPKPSPLLSGPSGIQSQRAWMWAAMESLLLDSNIYGHIVARDRNLWPTQIELVDPAAIQYQEPKPGYPGRPPERERWRINGVEVPADDIWHVAFNPSPGSRFGKPMIEHAREHIGLGLAATRYGAQFFGDGGHPTMVAEGDMPIGQPEAMDIKQKILQAVRGKREPLVVGAGIKVKPWQSSPSDAALVDVWAQNRTNVADYFGLPVEYVAGSSGGTSNITYANIEARAVELIRFCFATWHGTLEEALTLSVPRGQYVRFNYSAFLRADSKTRWEVHKLAREVGARSVNEIKRLEDEEPIGPEGDDYTPPGKTTTPTTPAASVEA